MIISILIWSAIYIIGATFTFRLMVASKSMHDTEGGVIGIFSIFWPIVLLFMFGNALGKKFVKKYFNKENE